MKVTKKQLLRIIEDIPARGDCILNISVDKGDITRVEWVTPSVYPENSDKPTEFCLDFRTV